MSLFGLHYNVTAPPPEPAAWGWAVPTGVMTAAVVAGLFSLISLIISKENKVTEFRQTWIDAQRNDLAEVLALAAALEAAPLEKRAENLAAFDRCFARILLRDNPKASVKREHRFVGKISLRWPSKDDWRVLRISRLRERPNPWRDVTISIGRLRRELSSAKLNSHSIYRCKRQVIIASRKLLKNEWDIVKDGEAWFAITRRTVGSFVVIAGALVILMVVVLVAMHL